MRRSWLAVVVALVFGLAFGQAAQQQEAQQQQVQQQPADPWADPRWTAPQWTAPAWTDPFFIEREVAMVRVAHLSPNAPAVDIRLSWLDLAAEPPEGEDAPETEAAEAFEEAQAELSGLEYGQITDYVLVPAGRHTVFVTDPEDELTIFHQIELDLASGAYYTVAAVGFVLGTDEEIDAAVLAEQERQEEGFFTWLENLFAERDREDLTFRIEVYDDVPSAFPSAGHANVRVIHASPGTPNVDVVARRVDTEGMAAIPAVPPADPAAPVAPAAPAAPAEPAPPAEEPVEEEPTEPEETEEEPEDADMASLEITVEPDDAAVTVVGPDGYSQEFSGSQTLTDLVPGTYIITATREGYEVAREEVEVEEGETATVELTLEEAEGAEPEAEEEVEEPEAADPAAAPADPAAAPPADPALAPVDPWFADFVVVGDVAFPSASDYAEVQAFGYELDVRLAGSDVLVHEFEDVSLEPGTIYTIFIIGTAMADYPVEAVILADVRLVSSPLEELDEEEPEEEEAEEEPEEEDEEENEEEEPGNGG